MPDVIAAVVLLGMVITWLGLALDYRHRRRRARVNLAVEDLRAHYQGDAAIVIVCGSPCTPTYATVAISVDSPAVIPIVAAQLRTVADHLEDPAGIPVP